MVRAEPDVLVHGDWHLGQLGRWRDGWRLLDIDDLGVGDPAWDLARPAGFWACGLLPDEDWQAFLDGYRTAGGPALEADGDAWRSPRVARPLRRLRRRRAGIELGRSTQRGHSLGTG